MNRLKVFLPPSKEIKGTHFSQEVHYQTRKSGQPSRALTAGRRGHASSPPGECPDQAGRWGQARRHAHRHTPGPGVHGHVQEASGLEIEVPEAALTQRRPDCDPRQKTRKGALAPCDSLLAPWEVPLESSPPGPLPGLAHHTSGHTNHEGRRSRDTFK